MLEISSAKSCEIEAVQVFYDQCSYGGGLNAGDLVLIARMGGQMVGAVRLCPEQDCWVLRGMQVMKAFQRQGIGRQLLKACTERLGRQACYCIPWAHLTAFYKNAGFQEVGLNCEVPNFLRERYLGYVARGMKVTLMIRSPQFQNNLNYAR